MAELYSIVRWNSGTVEQWNCIIRWNSGTVAERYSSTVHCTILYHLATIPLFLHSTNRHLQYHSALFYCSTVPPCHCVTAPQSYLATVYRVQSTRTGKRWRLYILPQYLANLTQPISPQKAIFFAQICPCASNIPYAKFEVFRTFLCLFMSVFRVLVR